MSFQLKLDFEDAYNKNAFENLETELDKTRNYAALPVEFSPVKQFNDSSNHLNNQTLNIPHPLETTINYGGIKLIDPPTISADDSSYLPPAFVSEMLGSPTLKADAAAKRSHYQPESTFSMIDMPSLTASSLPPLELFDKLFPPTLPLPYTSDDALTHSDQHPVLNQKHHEKLLEVLKNKQRQLQELKETVSKLPKLIDSLSTTDKLLHMTITQSPLAYHRIQSALSTSFYTLPISSGNFSKDSLNLYNISKAYNEISRRWLCYLVPYKSVWPTVLDNQPVYSRPSIDDPCIRVDLDGNILFLFNLHNYTHGDPVIYYNQKIGTMSSRPPDSFIIYIQPIENFYLGEINLPAVPNDQYKLLRWLEQISLHMSHSMSRYE